MRKIITFSQKNPQKLVRQQIAEMSTVVIIVPLKGLAPRPTSNKL